MPTKPIQRQQPNLYRFVVLATTTLIFALLAYSLLIQQDEQLLVDAEVSRAYAAEMQAIRVEADRKHYFEN